MKLFAALYEALDSTTSTHLKLQALVTYFQQASDQDAAWAVYFLAGGKPRQVVKTQLIRTIACERAGVDDWLFEECYQAVGDLAETIAHLLPPATQTHDQGLAQWVSHLQSLKGQDDDAVSQALIQAWMVLNNTERFLLTKLIGGGFRVGVSKLLVTRALAQFAGLDAKLVAQRMMGYTDGKKTPTAEHYQQLIAPVHEGDFSNEQHQPYPFFLAPAVHDHTQHIERLGHVHDWLAEWKYDGIRAQIVRRGGSTSIWSRGEELLTERFPELVQMAEHWPDGTVLDGEILVWINDQPAAFAMLQTRITRKQVSKKLLQDCPVIFMAYDCLQLEQTDMRLRTQLQRRQLLEEFCHQQTSPLLRLSARIQAMSWDELLQLRQGSRARAVEGLMLKHHQAFYGVGRTKDQGVWLKWKGDPLSIDCVLVYAQRGHGRRASLYTDYTFAVWDRSPTGVEQAQAVIDAIAQREPVEQTTARGLPRLVPFAKAYSGLSDEEFKQVDAVIRKTTLEKFGPVRSVVPSLVFELAFEGISRSTRHKSGIAVRFPRMLRIRHDKPLDQADSLIQLEHMMGALQISDASEGDHE